MNYHLRNICRIRKFVNQDTCHTVVRTLVTSRLDYCNSLYNGVSDKSLSLLQKLQNKAARTIYRKPKRTHTSPLIKDLHWLPVKQRVHFKSLTLTYKCLHKQAPTYLSNLLSYRQSSYKTRSSSQPTLNIPRTHKAIGDRAFSRFAPKLWSQLPAAIMHSQSVGSFKRSLKTHLF